MGLNLEFATGTQSTNFITHIRESWGYHYALCDADTEGESVRFAKAGDICAECTMIRLLKEIKEVTDDAVQAGLGEHFKPRSRDW